MTGVSVVMSDNVGYTTKQADASEVHISALSRSCCGVHDGDVVMGEMDKAIAGIMAIVTAVTAVVGGDCSHHDDWEGCARSSGW